MRACPRIFVAALLLTPFAPAMVGPASAFAPVQQVSEAAAYKALTGDDIAADDRPPVAILPWAGGPPGSLVVATLDGGGDADGDLGAVSVGLLSRQGAGLNVLASNGDAEEPAITRAITPSTPSLSVDPAIFRIAPGQVAVALDVTETLITTSTSAQRPTCCSTAVSAMGLSASSRRKPTTRCSIRPPPRDESGPSTGSFGSPPTGREAFTTSSCRPVVREREGPMLGTVSDMHFGNLAVADRSDRAFGLRAAVALAGTVRVNVPGPGFQASVTSGQVFGTVRAPTQLLLCLEFAPPVAHKTRASRGGASLGEFALTVLS